MPALTTKPSVASPGWSTYLARIWTSDPWAKQTNKHKIVLFPWTNPSFESIPLKQNWQKYFLKFYVTFCTPYGCKYNTTPQQFHCAQNVSYCLKLIMMVCYVLFFSASVIRHTYSDATVSMWSAWGTGNQCYNTKVALGNTLSRQFLQSHRMVSQQQVCPLSEVLHVYGRFHSSDNVMTDSVICLNLDSYQKW